MTEIRKELRANKPHQCENAYPQRDAHDWSRGVIEPGETYVRLSLTPNDDMVSNTKWLHARWCYTCAEVYR